MRLYVFLVIIYQYMRKLSTKEFIIRARLIHGNNYDYSKVDYKGSSLPVEIICTLHGSFWQSLESHIRQQAGCGKCNGGIESNAEEFIKKAISLHDDKYNYSLVDYNNGRTQVDIICLIHGIFKQTPHDHLAGNGCMDCCGKAKIDYNEFIAKSNKIHNFKYNYFQESYTNYKTKTKIECPIHGLFIFFLLLRKPLSL